MSKKAALLLDLGCRPLLFLSLDRTSKRSSEIGQIKLITHYFFACSISLAHKFPGTPGMFQISRNSDLGTGNLISRDPEPIFPGTRNLQTVMQIVLRWVFMKAERRNEQKIEKF